MRRKSQNTTLEGGVLLAGNYAIPTPRSEPEHRWEGPMTGETGSASHLRGTLLVTLTFRDGRISGGGYSHPYPYDCPKDDRQVAIIGDYAGDAIYLDITFPTSPVFRTNLYAFAGTISADRKEIRGVWHFRCNFCTCGGSRGTLVLTRVAEE
jgi:hypothetical protein